jgi:hypothetical protein
MSRGLLCFMAAVTQLGLVVLTTGLSFYVTGRAPIVEPDAGTLLGPAMVVVSMATVFFPLARRFGVDERDGRRHPSERSRILPLAASAAVASYVAMLLVGGLVYAAVRGEIVWLVLFAGRYAAAPFVVGSSAWAGVVVAGFLILAHYDTASRSRSDPPDDAP